MSRSMEYWRNAWDNADSGTSDDSKFPSKNKNAAKLFALLSEYAALGAIPRSFFSHKPNVRHASQVEQVIACFYGLTGVFADRDDFHGVDFIVAQIQEKIGGYHTKLDGNLAKIFTVLREKTDVGYDLTFGAERVIYNYMTAPKPPGYSPNLNAYIASFAKKQCFQSQLAELSLTEAEQQEVDEKFSCVILFCVMNIPVFLYENFYDLSSLENQTKDPITMQAFIPRDIQTARPKMNEMDAFIKEVTARIENEPKLGI